MRPTTENSYPSQQKIAYFSFAWL